MTSLKKQRVVAVIKYTWPLYIISVVIIILLMNFLFGVIHRTPDYKTLTLFISGEVTNDKKLKDDLLDKFSDKELKSVSTISVKVNDGNYSQKLTITGYNGADILIIPTSKLDKLDVASFGLELSNEVITSFYQDNTFYKKDDTNYGVKLDKEKVKDYMSLPEEDCYMILNGKSSNIGEYGPEQNKEHNNALTLVQDWGM